MAADTNDYGANFKLTEDIDLGPKVPGGQVFNTAVIANDIDNSSCDFNGIAFTGVFDGAGHKIVNLTINTFGAGSDYLGLFGRISGGKVKNLILENISIKGGDGSYYIGGLVGSNSGTIRNCSATGAVTGGEYSYNLGDLVGENSNGIIVNCHPIATAEAKTPHIDSFFTINK